jgi:hypothetical protein
VICPKRQFESLSWEGFLGLIGDVGCIGTGGVTAIEREALDLAADRV